MKPTYVTQVSAEVDIKLDARGNISEMGFGRARSKALGSLVSDADYLLAEGAN